MPFKLISVYDGWFSMLNHAARRMRFPMPFEIHVITILFFLHKKVCATIGEKETIAGTIAGLTISVLVVRAKGGFAIGPARSEIAIPYLSVDCTWKCQLEIFCFCNPNVASANIERHYVIIWQNCASVVGKCLRVFKYIFIINLWKHEKV